uniref:Type Ia crustin cruIa-3 n=1 Tax=Penaeus vannamei TaxID=6689 RepID=A0A7L9R3G2_PENVA|nr:type Ia crustin cruIa-3 [Penaeus vannamei]
MQRLSLLVLAACLSLAMTTSIRTTEKPCEDYCEIEGQNNQYECCDRNSGWCPTVRPSCLRNSGVIPYCRYDTHCEKHEKCCEDACLGQKVCKPADRRPHAG